MRSTRASDTREAIMTEAERLFAELGVFAVSNRQVSEAAGQGNNAAVGYHFGTKADLIHAIVKKHMARVDAIRIRHLDERGASKDLRDWLTCLVRPSTDHLAELGNPTWYARFSAQILTDPNLRIIMQDESLASPALQRTLAGMRRCIPDLPSDVRASRGEMARTLMIHVIADQERLMADQRTEKAPTWDEVGTNLIDALFGLWHAPVSR
ncbi:TetR/AcrR family transcriptional regulator [Rhodococcus sp. P1Y]|nr:TetR/AcrR family transcriptional regulator [Rhodococcus sp. P1Y]